MSVKASKRLLIASYRGQPARCIATHRKGKIWLGYCMEARILGAPVVTHSGGYPDGLLESLLAKKLTKTAKVFGECLLYAIQNREEWKEKGREIVAEMMIKEVADMNFPPL